MKTINQLPILEINPVEKAERSIIWLHGLGADGNDFAPIVPELHLPSSLKIRFVFPHAPIMPVSINNGYEMRAWFDIPHPDLTKDIDFDGIDRSREAINMLIQQEHARGIAAENIIMVGFSQGAVMALTTGLFYPEKIAGVVALSGLLPQAKEHAEKSIHRDLPVFIAHGTEDLIVPYRLGEEAAQGLKQAGFPVSWHSYQMGHTVCGKEVADISGWIQNIWK